MICQRCGKKEATTHIKKIVNGETSELHLCADCAGSAGYTAQIPAFGLNLNDLFGGFFGDSPMSRMTGRTIRCEACGSSFDDIVKSGMAGCAECYRTFYDKLLPSITRIHGNARHNGKLPQSASEEDKKAHRLADLKSRLNRAIDEQNFELAAKLRDEIKETEAAS